MNNKDSTIKEFFKLAVQNHQKNNLSEAANFYEKILKINPEHFHSIFYLGTLSVQIKNYERSIELLKKAIKINPLHADANNNLGLSFKKKNKNEEARKYFEKAIEINPKHLEAHNNLGILLKKLNKNEEARKYFEKAIEINPNHAGLHNDLGVVFHRLGENEKARKCYEKAIEINSNYTPAHNNLMELFEDTNQDEKLNYAILKAETSIKNEPIINLFKGRILYKNEKFYEAINKLEKISFEDDRAVQEQSRLFTLAKCYDHLENIDQAFNNFEKLNHISLKQKESTINKNIYLKHIEKRKNFFEKNEINKWVTINLKSEKPDPIFMIGFPRSGTTLLDTILGSHPSIEVIEEKPTIVNMINSLNELQNDGLKSLEKIKNNEVQKVRKIYFDTLKTEIKNVDSSKIYIDKLPLNIINVGEIYRIFPKAKFIFSLRHPCDCVLSCFMQNFELNNAMANFLNLEDSAKLYDSVMKLWTQYTSIFPINYHEIRYENIISDFESTIKSVLDFLELPWDKSVLEYYKTARKKDRIYTPSYTQVIKPIYSHASGRWKMYKKQIKNIYPILEPWIKKFNY